MRYIPLYRIRDEIICNWLYDPTLRPNQEEVAKHTE